MITLPWETWRAAIDVLRARGLPDKRDHANDLGQQLEQHGQSEPTV
jgi:hypothetical protein